MPRKVRTRYREHECSYAEFVAFVGDIRAVDLTGEHFRDYHDHVHRLAQAKAKPNRGGGRRLSNPDRWVNHRFGAVTTAFRRVKRRFPESAWPQDWFGTDGLLAILEQRNTATIGKQVPITPAEFRAMLDVADTQWRALLMLSLNCALKNSDMLIPWSAIDFERGVMEYPRPKTRRTRRTPLAPQTLAALRAWRAESKNGRAEIFVTPHGNPWIGTTDSVAKHWDYLRKRVEEMTGHRTPATFDSMRKTPGKVIFEGGVPNAKEAIQFLLGQKPHEACRHYVGVIPEVLFPAAQTIRKAFFER